MNPVNCLLEGTSSSVGYLSLSPFPKVGHFASRRRPTRADPSERASERGALFRRRGILSYGDPFYDQQLPDGREWNGSEMA